MENCSYLLVGSHGNFARELVKSAEMIVGEMEQVRAFSLEPGMSLADFVAEIRPVLEEMRGPGLCLVDLFGGTPSNTFAALSGTYDIQVVSGLNMGMLIEAYSSLGQVPAEELKEIAINALKESCRDVTANMQEQ